MASLSRLRLLRRYPSTLTATFLLFTLTYLLFLSVATVSESKRSTLPSPSKIVTIESARDLFTLILPLLKSENDSIVSSVVNALGFTSRKAIFSDEPRHKARDRYLNTLRVEIGHIYHLTADFFQQQHFEPDDGDSPLPSRFFEITPREYVFVVFCFFSSLLASLMDIVRDYIISTKAYLYQTSGRHQWDLQLLRYHFCGFIEKVYDSVCQNETLCSNFFPPAMRASLFYLFEQYCSGKESFDLKDWETKMMATVSQHFKDPKKRDVVKATLQERQGRLELAANQAMASLLKGKVVTKEKLGGNTPLFNINGLFKWIYEMFQAKDDQYHKLAQSALESLLSYNKEPTFLETVVNDWYSLFILIIIIPKKPRLNFSPFLLNSYVGKQNSAATQGEFLALVDIFARNQEYPCRLPVLLNLAMYKIADPDVNIRKSGL